MIHYLSEKDITLINTYVIQTYSPKEQLGVKEPTALNMTVNALKQNVFGREGYPTLTLKAANLYRNIVMKHIFYNGNKRTAFTSLLIFLKLNGKELDVEEDTATEFTVSIVTQQLDELTIANWIEKHLKERE